MSEAQEQEAVIQYCDYRHIPVFHIPNGGKRNAREAAHFKRQGVRPGVPDLFVPVARGGHHGLFIEMKSKSGKTTAQQEKWLALLDAQGYMSCVCYGADQAIATIQSYIG